MLWPTVTLVGWFAMAALVIALGRGSTSRYEVERGRVLAQAAPAPAGTPAPGAGADVGRQAMAAPAEGATQPEPRPSAVATASHPAGRRMQAGTSAWWLVDGWDGEQAGSVVAGPFPGRFDAEWAALADGHPATTRPAHGVQGPGGELLRRQTQDERAWFAELGDSLDRLPDDWDGLLTEEDALTTLVVDVGAALLEAGLPLHDGAEREPGADGPAGGVCLTPELGTGGVLVAWRQHDRMDLQHVRGTAAGTAVRRTMTTAVAQVLTELGFELEPIGPWGCYRVLPLAQD
jgi:hypothetical protein